MSESELKRHLEFLEHQVPAVPTVAFFDLDRTLIAGYSIVALAWERVRHGLGRGELNQSMKILRAAIKQKNDPKGGKLGRNYQGLVRRLSKSLAGISEETLSDLGERAYHNSLARSLYREAIALVEAHRAAGHHLVIVSAASRYQIEPIARVLGIEEICCTQLEVVNGKFTGRVVTPLCFGEGKAMAARRVSRRLKVSMKNCWFYSDSSDDLPLLRKVGHPVAVNASEKLATHARANNWPQLNFESRGLPSIESVVRTGLTLQSLAATTAYGAMAKRLSFGKLASPNLMTQVVGDLGSGFAGLDLEIEGVEHLTAQRPAVFIFNHQSLLDSMVIAHLLQRDIVALCKKEMGDKPVATAATGRYYICRTRRTGPIRRAKSGTAGACQRSIAGNRPRGHAQYSGGYSAF